MYLKYTCIGTVTNISWGRKEKIEKHILKTTQITQSCQPRAERIYFVLCHDTSNWINGEEIFFGDSVVGGYNRMAVKEMWVWFGVDSSWSFNHRPDCQALHGGNGDERLPKVRALSGHHVWVAWGLCSLVMIKWSWVTLKGMRNAPIPPLTDSNLGADWCKWMALDSILKPTL